MPSRAYTWAWSLAIVIVVAAFGSASAEAGVSPVLSGTVSDSATLPGTDAVAVSGHYAYAVGYYAGRLVAIDISNPAAPMIAGWSQASNELLNATTVNIAGGYAYVVSKNRNGPEGSGNNEDGTGNSLTILDISSNPAEPRIVGSIRNANTLFGAYGVAVSGNYAFVASQGCLSGQPCPISTVGNAFAVLDISNPVSPSIVASVQTLPPPWAGTGALKHATSVAVSGNYAYVTAPYADRLTVLNIANPLSPQIVASIKDTTTLNFPVDVAVSGHYAYVVDQVTTGRLTVVDVSNPNEPQVVASLANASLNGAYRIRVRGDFAYISASTAADVAVVDISNPLSPRFAASVADSANLHTTTGLDVDPSGTHVVAVSPLLSGQKQPLYPPFALQPGGPTLTGTVSDITLDPSPITVSITAASKPPNPTAQTSANFSFTFSDTVAAVQCQLDGGSWLPCTTHNSQTYSALGSGTHTFMAQAVDAAGNTNTASYSWKVVAPANVSPPSISGSASVGQLLSASPGSWTGSPTFAYQWLRCDIGGMSCLPIGGATSSSYTVVTADTESTLEVQVTATTSAGSSSVESSPTAVVAGPPAIVQPPTVSGSPAEGQVLSASSGSWSGYPAPSFTYQWQRCNGSGQECAVIQGATASSYTALSADVGFTLVVEVTASNSAGSTPASSAASAVVVAAAEPLTPLLDNFARSNNTGPPGPNWTHMIVSSTSSTNNFFITNEQITGYAGSNADYWNPQAYGPNSEVWVTVATKPNADQDPVVLGLRFQNPGAANASGYQAYYIYRSKQADQYKIISRTNGTTSTTLAAGNGPTLNPGDHLLFRAIGSTLELWRLDAGTWTRVLAATDGTYPEAGYLTLTARDGAVRLTNFGGGTLP